jgi:hypothetical protein
MAKRIGEKIHRSGFVRELKRRGSFFSNLKQQQTRGKRKLVNEIVVFTVVFLNVFHCLKEDEQPVNDRATRADLLPCKTMYKVSYGSEADRNCPRRCPRDAEISFIIPAAATASSERADNRWK